MDTNFFNQITQLDITGDLHMVIAKGEKGNLIVSILLQNDSCTDKAKDIIPPLTLRGTGQELDQGFFENLRHPLETASGLMVNMESFMKQLDQVRKQSAMEKEKTDKEKIEKEIREKKYRNAMLKVDTFEKDQRYRDAWTALPKPSEYPEYAEIIRKRQDDFARHFAPDLFNAEEIPQEILPQDEE